MDYQEHFTNTDTCVITFASGEGREFEFHKSLQKIGIAHVTLRDPTGCWYEKGVYGIGEQRAVKDYINKLKLRYSKIITTGVSLGSYGALLYGQIAPATEIIAISPLTVLGPRGAKEFAGPLAHRVATPHLDLDLKPYFPTGPATKIRAFISDGDGAELDRQMTERLGITDITLIPGHTHGALARHMRDAGWFEKIYQPSQNFMYGIFDKRDTD